MNIEDRNFLIISVFIVLIVSVGVMTAGAELRATRTLDNQSKEYLDQFNSDVETNGIDDLIQETESLDKESNPLLDKVGELPIISDFLGAVNFFKEKTKFVWTFISMIFNVPTFLLSSLGLPIGVFSVYINVLGAILFLAALLALLAVVK